MPNPLEAGYRYLELVEKDHPSFENVVEQNPRIHPFDIKDAFKSANLNFI